ncbi:asparagine synthase C-terminal domain-containing protein [Brevundimonas variabilis]|uniref:Asparagine synthase (Glutamine-hydrolyzing) n=1 Tax=Brevundimonas variabilis TaxID=74312 RepID=A0A7W9FF39_9CAUL|nr:asparagine synthase C-terminal domain-containing protein [Brevundimonas variabilis]MBB5747086.1 asparagine synthase (glutamine-hydrolyzing) [Brevundimonas variabilis]
MRASTPDRRGYVVIDQDGMDRDRPEFAEAVRQLLVAGWRKALDINGVSIFLGPDSPLKVTQVHRQHFLVGDWRGGDASLSTLIAQHRSDTALAHAVVSHGWGRYVLVWRDDDCDLRLLRDPSGALDCICWRYASASIATSQPPEALNPVLPNDLAIDWTVLGEIVGAVNLASDQLALTGLHAVTPGSLAQLGVVVTQEAIWTPARFAATARDWDDRPEALVAVVDRAVAELVDGHSRIVTEISGGLDSAIVAASLVANGGASKSRFVNYFDDQPEGDERAFARAAAHTLGVNLEEVHKPIAALGRRQFDPLGQGVRPALHGIDMVYDAEMAGRARKVRATGLLTGHGGDAVFFQSPDPLVVADRLRREGLSGLNPGYVASVARWTRHSVWTIARHSLFPKPRPPASTRRHRWVDGAEALPPAKARQVLQLANCQTFWSDCLRARSATLLHPLLTQPVMEHCLAIPADRLTLGARDRGLARIAFKDRLPSLIVDRRDKGDLSRFYASVVRQSVDVVTELLVGGRLAEKGLISTDDFDQALSDARLIWDPATNRFLILGAIEVWARSWEARLDRVRRAKVAVEPLENT